jgi:hypothetical protein
MFEEIKLLPMQVNNTDIKDIYPDLEPTDTIIGILPDDLKRFSCVLSDISKYKAEMSIELSFKRSTEHDRMLFKEISNREQMISWIFWYEVKKEFNIWNYFTQDLSIRNGFQLVKIKRENSLFGFPFPFERGDDE